MSSGFGRTLVLAGGTALSVAGGLLSYFASGRDVALSVVVGLQVQTLTLLVEGILALTRRDTLVGRAARLIERIEAIPNLEIQLDEIATNLSTVRDRYRGTLAPDEAVRLLADCQSQIRDLSIGHLFRDSYDPSLKMQLLGPDHGHLRTTSLQSHDLAWHRSEVGRAYWGAQLAALRRGWTIERIFIYYDWSPDLNDLAIEQCRAGIKVFRILLMRTPHDLQVDFSIWNRSHAYQQWIRRTEGLLEDRFTVEEADVVKYHDMWGRLVAITEPCTVDMLEAIRSSAPRRA